MSTPPRCLDLVRHVAQTRFGQDGARECYALWVKRPIFFFDKCHLRDLTFGEGRVNMSYRIKLPGAGSVSDGRKRCRVPMRSMTPLPATHAAVGNSWQNGRLCQ